MSSSIKKEGHSDLYLCLIFLTLFDGNTSYLDNGLGLHRECPNTDCSHCDILHGPVFFLNIFITFILFASYLGC